MPVLTREQEKQSAVFKMPEVSVGMPVLWYMDGNEGSAPYVGIILRFNQRTVDLEVHAPNAMPRFKAGVRHVDDPMIQDSDVYQMGAWGYTDQTKRLHCLEIQVRDLMSDLAPASPASSD